MTFNIVETVSLARQLRHIGTCMRRTRSCHDLMVLVALAATALGSESSASTLSDAAAALSPGESIRVATVLPASLLNLDGFEFLQWGSSAVWDPLRREFRYIGKRYSPYPYRFLVYDEKTNSWTSNRSLHSDLTGSLSGHGYDHNTVDPRTGTHYFYFNSSVYAWSGTWSVIRLPSGYRSVAAGLTWVDQFAQTGVAHSGLLFVDDASLLRYDGTNWISLGSTPVQSYHTVAEYSPGGNAVLIGAGNGGNAMWKVNSQTRGVASVATPPFNLGAAESQGLLVAAPGADQFVGWDKSSGGWTQYDVSANAWSPIARSSGAGSSAQAGAPNLSSSYTSVIAAPISTYGVIMFVQVLGSNDAAVWLYKHSSGAQERVPNPPSELSAR